MTSPFKKGGTLGMGANIAHSIKAAAQKTEGDLTEDAIFASVGDDALLASVSDLADKQTRSLAAAIAVEFSTGEDNTYSNLESLVIGAVADPEDEEESDLDEEEHKDFNELLSVVADALIKFSGKEIKLVQKAFDDEDDDLLESIASAVAEKMKGESDDEMIADYAVREEILLSAVKKVIRGGQVKLVKTNRKKKRMSPAQKAALKKAQKKSHNSASRAKRKKSNRVRKQRGM